VGEATELRYVARTRGGEYAGPCPFCGGEDRFRVWPESDRPGWWCRRCNRSGDAIQFLRDYHHLPFHQARDLAEGGLFPFTPAGHHRRGRGPQRQATTSRPGTGADHDGMQLVRNSHTESSPCGSAQEPLTVGGQRAAVAAEPNRDRWQRRAQVIIPAAEHCLWGERGELVHRYLQEERGLREDAIRCWRLGFVPWNVRERATARGFAGNSAVTVPAGILLPCLVDGVCWSLKVRRPLGLPGPKYLQVRGSHVALFGAHTLIADGAPQRTVFLTEGEFDASAPSAMSVSALSGSSKKTSLPRTQKRSRAHGVSYCSRSQSLMRRNP
jgi:hypothetical protein